MRAAPVHQAFHFVFLVLFLGSLAGLFLGLVAPLVFRDSDRPPLPRLGYLVVAAVVAASALAADWMVHNL